MKIFSTFIGVVIGVALFVSLLAGGYFLFKYIASIFATLEPQIETLAVIASIVALLCAVIIAEGLKARGLKEYNSIASAEKAKLYERLLSFWSELLKDHPNSEYGQVTETELIKLDQLLALHGSEKVIATYINFRRYAKKDVKPTDKVLELLQKLLVEMRTDIGRKEQKLNKSDVLDLLLERN